ncbi:MAG: hypothetical protein VX438_16910, partial [Planctomycetota bacterium]|nr:hypothetical protein [Planctomycetota bacterium]
MKDNSISGNIALQFKTRFRKIQNSLAIHSAKTFIKKVLHWFQSPESDSRRLLRPKCLRYELCEARMVLDAAAPFAPDGGDDDDGFSSDANIPVYVDGNFEFGDLTAQFPYGRKNTFKLASKPSATKTIYLDYDGHHSVGNWWNHDIVFPAFDTDGDSSNFSDAELSQIQKQFLHVVED